MEPFQWGEAFRAICAVGRVAGAGAGILFRAWEVLT